MKKLKHIILLTNLLLLTSVLSFGQGSPLVDKTAMDDFKKGENVEKGVVGQIDYTVTTGIHQILASFTVKFDVQVEAEQKVLIEVFNEYGDLTEVVYNDYMPANQLHNFTLNKLKWGLDAEAHYLRVTTDEYIENHEIK